MYERFTDRARKVMQLANQEGCARNSQYVWTGYILLGLVKDDAGMSALVLDNLNVNRRTIVSEVEKSTARSEDGVTMGKLPLTPTAKDVLAYATEEARRLNHNYIGTEHLLLGLLRVTDGIALGVLRKMGVTLESVRDEIAKLLGGDIVHHMKPPTFTRNWFEEFSRPLWEYWLKDHAVDRYLEIGVLEGQSMLWVINAKHPRLAVGIDSYTPARRRDRELHRQFRETAHANLKPYIDSGVVALIERRSQAILGEWYQHGQSSNEDGFDMILVDGDHRGRQALEDMVLAWPLLRVGGIMVLDDYDRRWRRHMPQSHEAIDGFLMAYEGLYKIVHRNERQVMIRKVKEE